MVVEQEERPLLNINVYLRPSPRKLPLDRERLLFPTQSLDISGKQQFLEFLSFVSLRFHEKDKKERNRDNDEKGHSR